MRANRTELPPPLAAPRPPELRESGRDRFDRRKLRHRESEKLAPWVCFQLIVATSLVLWIAVIEVFREAW
jgi:hypothetical protein